MQTIVLRGVPATRLKQSLKQENVPAYKCDSVKSMLSYYLSCTTYASASQVTAIEKALPINPFYPKIFDDRVGRTGSIIDKRASGIRK